MKPSSVCRLTLITAVYSYITKDDHFWDHMPRSAFAFDVLFLFYYFYISDLQFFQSVYVPLTTIL